MAADVSSLARMLSGYKEEGEGKRDLVTRDLLGGGAVLGSAAEVDLELQVPVGWERRLDLLSGKTYLQKRESNPSPQHLHDLNLPPPPSSSSTAGVLPEDSTALDLKLVAPSPSATTVTSSCEYQSVCTLEKVKSALERAERESRIRLPLRPRSDGSPSPSSSTTSSSIKRRAAADHDDDGMTEGSDSSGGMIAAGCPGCLLYVLIAKVDPRCPRCDSHVPVPALKKKPKIDLNSAQADLY